MKTFLIINIVGLAVALCAIAFLFALFVRAERKLAKYGESVIFRSKK